MTPATRPPIILALDFDGVICDSSREVFRTALETWNAVTPESRIREEISIRPEFIEAFSRLVPLGNRAEDFCVALHILVNGIDVPDQEAYDRVRDRMGTHRMQIFHDAFYRVRERLRSSDPKTWSHLHDAYEPIADLLRRRRSDVVRGIVTAKDRESVQRLLDHFGLSELFPEHLIFDKETGVVKTNHIRAMAATLGVDPSNMTFVDDKYNHLLATRPLGVRGVLAAWGHNGEREWTAAADAGFAVATLETAESVLFPEP